MAIKDRKLDREAIEAETVEVKETVVYSEQTSAQEMSPEEGVLTPAQQFVKSMMLEGINGFIGLIKKAEQKYSV